MQTIRDAPLPRERERLCEKMPQEVITTLEKIYIHHPGDCMRYLYLLAHCTSAAINREETHFSLEGTQTGIGQEAYASEEAWKKLINTREVAIAHYGFDLIDRIDSFLRFEINKSPPDASVGFDLERLRHCYDYLDLLWTKLERQRTDTVNHFRDMAKAVRQREEWVLNEIYGIRGRLCALLSTLLRKINPLR